MTTITLKDVNFGNKDTITDGFLSRNKIIRKSIKKALLSVWGIENEPELGPDVQHPSTTLFVARLTASLSEYAFVPICSVLSENHDDDRRG